MSKCSAHHSESSLRFFNEFPKNKNVEIECSLSFFFVSFHNHFAKKYILSSIQYIAQMCFDGIIGQTVKLV